MFPEIYKLNSQRYNIPVPQFECIIPLFDINIDKELIKKTVEFVR
jgi:hypothetical protein